MKKVFLGFGLILLMTAVLITMAITGEVAKDPVCKMDVDIAKATIKIEGKNGNLYFCSQNCKDKFLADPNKYVVQADLDKMGVAVGKNAACGGCPMEQEHAAATTGAATPAVATGCPMGKAATTGEAKTAENTACDSNCGNTKVHAINDFHSSMHVMEAAVNANNLEAVKTVIPDLLVKKEAVMKAECPEGKCPNSFDTKRAELGTKVDALAAVCQKGDAAAIKTAFGEMHDAYTALDHTAR